MAKLTQRIYGPPQSGKTTAAAALVHGYTQLGIHAAFVAASEAEAVGVAQRHKIPLANVYGWTPELMRRGVLDRYQAIVLDEAQRMSGAEGDAVDMLIERYAFRVVPFPTLIAFYMRRGEGHASA